MLPFFHLVQRRQMEPFIYHLRAIYQSYYTPSLLGVILNRSLPFNAHIKHIKQSLSSRFQAITVTTHASWGWCKPLLWTVFHALVCSRLGYTAPAWQPWLSNTNITSLDHLQNQALRLIPGQLVSTPLEALRLEFNVQSCYTISKRLIVPAREKCLRTETGHPKWHSFLNILSSTPASVVKLLNFRSSFQRNSSIDKSSIFSHLLHGQLYRSAPTKSLPPCKVSLTTTIHSHISHKRTWTTFCHIKSTTPSMPTVRQVQAQGIVGKQQLSPQALLLNQLLKVPLK